MSEVKIPENVYELLGLIQVHLKAPKSNVNAFGKYKYRSCEDIVEAVKPHLAGGILTMTDNIVLVGDRYYVEATAVLTYKGSHVAVKALAREPEDKKGSDASQITGAASSYARKYALNGLLLIDDTKDADTMDNKDDKSEKPGKENVRLISELNQVSDPVKLKAWWHENEARILALPEDQQEMVDNQYQYRLKQVESGDTAPGAWKFANVGESEAWRGMFNDQLAACKTLVDVNNLVQKNTPYLKALLGQKDGKKYIDIAREDIAKKRDELTPKDMTGAG